MTALKSMNAKFKGKCFECGNIVFAGEKILWSKRTGAKHADCTQAACSIKAAVTTPGIPTTELGDYTEVYAMFASCAKTNKFPKITIDADGCEFYLYVSGPNAKISGVINVKGRGSYGTWYGRITQEGTWTHRANVDERMADALSKLSMDPVATVAAYGKLCGRCCFCNSTLSDDKDGSSLDVGYGPVCAKKWGLPHGKKAKVNASGTETGRVHA